MDNVRIYKFNNSKIQLDIEPANVWNLDKPKGMLKIESDTTSVNYAVL